MSWVKNFLRALFACIGFVTLGVYIFEWVEEKWRTR